MTNNKSKTKTEILNELESIKGLLHEEDDIPVLQEMIAGEQFSKKNMSGKKILLFYAC